jgi:hypothetical protein
MIRRCGGKNSIRDGGVETFMALGKTDRVGDHLSSNSTNAP